MDPIEQFVQQLLDDMGRELQPAVREQMVSDFVGRVNDLINRRMIDALPSARVEELERLIDRGGSVDELQQFFATHVNDPEAVAAGALLEFRSRYIKS